MDAKLAARHAAASSSDDDEYTGSSGRGAEDVDHISTPMGKRKRKMCEGCGLNVIFYGLASVEGKVRWCAGCGAAEGAAPRSATFAL